MTFQTVLRLCKSGVPRDWINVEQAVTLYAKDQVLWSLGIEQRIVFGGERGGLRSHMTIAPIIACGGRVLSESRFTPAFSNTVLFKRDDYRCLYCGEHFHASRLTIDHIVPVSLGGATSYVNTVSSCAPCNSRKGARTPEEAGMPLLAVPFVPNRFEWFYLAGRKIQSEQAEYLKPRFSMARNWAA